MRKRKRLLVNWTVQGPILRRLCVHLVTFVAAMSSLLMIFWMIQGSAVHAIVGKFEEPLHTFWYRAVPFISASLALLPLIVWDMLRITNRLAGPLYRFEQVMRDFEETGKLDKAKLRDNDLLTEFCSRFNNFVAVMHERYPECADGIPQAQEVDSIKCFGELPAPANEPAAV